MSHMPDDATEGLAKHSSRLQPPINLHAPVTAFMFITCSGDDELYKYNLAVYMFRIINNLIPPLTHHQFIFNSSIHHHNTRSQSKIHTRYCRTAMRQNTFAFQGPRLWSELPSYLTAATSLPIFKKMPNHFCK